MALVAPVKLTTGSKKKEKGEQRITLHCSPFTVHSSSLPLLLKVATQNFFIP